MQNRKKRFALKVGYPPESLIYTGDVILEPNIMRLVSYNEQDCESFTSVDINQIFKEFKQDRINWISISSLHNTGLVEQIGKYFDIHSLMLEDVLNSEQFPKLEETKQHLILTLKHMYFKQDGTQVAQSHISLILGKNYIITFSEGEQDIFKNIRENILSGKGKLRSRSADFLFYFILDAIVDSYYLIFEQLQDQIEALEDRLLSNRSYNFINEIHAMKKLLSSTRKTINPLLEATNKLTHEDVLYIDSSSIPYMKDVADHVFHLTDIYETCRDMLTGQIDLNMSNQNNNLNNVIKTLTIVSTIFIPLTFLVGVYGMNFKFMPELEWKWGYPSVVIFMVAVSITMIIVMKNKKWF